MKRKIHDALLGLVGVAGLAFFALSGASCEIPKMQCAVGHGPFTVVYEVTSGDASCYETPHKQIGGACGNYDLLDTDPDCAGLAKVEEVGFATYLTPKGRREVKDDTGKVIGIDSDGADYHTRKIAVQSTTMGAAYRGEVPIGTVAPDGSGEPYAIGKYTSDPDAQDLCYAGGANGTEALNVAEINFPDDMVHFRQTWSGIKFYVTEGVPGTQVVGNMKFEDVTAGCSVEYKFTGIYPAVFCGAAVMGQRDDDGDPNTPPENDTDDDGDPMTPVTDDDGMPGPDMDAEVTVGYDPDDGACDPVANTAAGRPTGSGINPDFKTYCHPDYLHCVLKDGTGLIPQ
jgi:hypothetical protein